MIPIYVQGSAPPELMTGFESLNVLERRPEILLTLVAASKAKRGQSSYDPKDVM
jgi:hypothetical protein